MPGKAVRPTQDRVRQALFSALATRIAECRFLDLFAGSGAVGLDAWSRGAGRVVWVERDPRVARVLQANVQGLCAPGGDGTESRVQVVRADALRFLEKGQGLGPFDLIFADPPYDRDGERGWLERILAALNESPLLAGQGLVIMEQSARETPILAAGWRLLAERSYGETVLRTLCRG